MNKSIIKCVALSKIFADGKLFVEVLKDLDLEILSGETVSIIGTSGAGKSTLLHLLGGLDYPTAGYVEICGENISKLSAKAQGILRNKHMGFIYQFHHLLPEFDALENVTMPLLIAGIEPKLAKQRAGELLAKVGLAHRISHRIGELSGGERQRVAIARALVNEPDCVLADEPTGNLDHKTAADIMDLILKLNSELKISFLIATHDLSLAKKMQRQLILESGELNVTGIVE